MQLQRRLMLGRLQDLQPCRKAFSVQTKQPLPLHSRATENPRALTPFWPGFAQRHHAASLTMSCIFEVTRAMANPF